MVFYSRHKNIFGRIAEVVCFGILACSHGLCLRPPGVYNTRIWAIGHELGLAAPRNVSRFSFDLIVHVLHGTCQEGHGSGYLGPRHTDASTRCGTAASRANPGLLAGGWQASVEGAGCSNGNVRSGFPSAGLRCTSAGTTRFATTSPRKNPWQHGCYRRCGGE